MKKNTKISIVIPSYNQGIFLEETIQSIVSQNYDNVEIIVMDGGSTDQSVDIIKKYEKYIYYWQSRKDNGQSYAINEGFKIATGDFVTWLNSDDVFIDGTLSTVDDYIKKHPNTDWFLGNCVWIDKDSMIVRVGKIECESKFWNRRNIFSNGGPSAFMRKSKLEEIGFLREDFHYAMDTELWHRYLSLDIFFVRIDRYCWGFRIHEEGKTSGHNFMNSTLSNKNHPSWKQKEKENNIISNLYPINNMYYQIWRFMKVFNKSVFSRIVDRRFIGKSYKQLESL
ncbi:MAG: glycosyltransferase family 2 protein [Bacteroides sp.]|nr:glycosyltransferase family 2 protein [Bacteroides sp.]